MGSCGPISWIFSAAVVNFFAGKSPCEAEQRGVGARGLMALTGPLLTDIVLSSIYLPCG
ncbi:MAG: hypothetical protein ACFFD4_14535 [Candidatus Odinarchaeota archaeon]